MGLDGGEAGGECGGDGVDAVVFQVNQITILYLVRQRCGSYTLATKASTETISNAPPYFCHD